MHAIGRLVLPLAALVALAACTSAPVRDEIPPFRQGVATARQQTMSALSEVNRFLRDQQIERAIGLATLSEEEFAEAIDSADIAKWDRAFAQIESYAGKLERLLHPDRRAGVERELAELGERVGTLRDDQVPATLTTGFTRLGGILVQMKAGEDALDAIRKADPALQELFNMMAGAIGEDPDSGVRGTVRTSWNTILGRISTREFLPATGESAKRAAVNKYVDTLDERDVQDRLLASINLSLSTLAKAHEQLAAGQPATAGAFIQLVQAEYEAFRRQLAVTRERRNAENQPGDNP